MSQHTGDAAWYDDVRVLWAGWREFFPAADQTPAERLNALVRLVAYATAAVFVYNREVRTLVLGACVVAVVSFAFSHRARPLERPPAPAPAGPLSTAAPPARPPACTPPTKDNPFANVLLTDLSKGPRAPACDYEAVKDDVRRHFNDGLFRNSDDIYERENSQHAFYTMPVTTGVPDTGAFANFLYGGMKSCKEDAAAC